MLTENDIAPEELTEKILEEFDDLTAFDCSTDDPMKLDEFIHSEAIQFQKEKLGVTHLFLHNGQVVGFATLAMSEIEIKEAPHLLSFKTKIKDYPALQIGRLAVRNDYRDRHIGRIICLRCLEIAKGFSKELGCKLVLVFTEGKPVEFYRKCGFSVIPKYEGKEKKWMYIQVP
jgi:N-acetylglutamate synthase-like GNAT family acetyltransferase